MKISQKIHIQIKRLGIHGEGIGDYQGLTIFIAGALPEETVTASVTEIRKNFARAKLLHIDQPSAKRVTPPCPVFGRCGGCQLMHLDYQEQLQMKRQRVIDALERIGKLFDIPVAPCIPSPKSLHYRNKIQLPVDENGRMGLYAFNSHDLVEIEKCYIHCPLGEEVFSQVRAILQKCQNLKTVLIKTALHTNQVLVILVTQGSPNLSEIAQKLMQAHPKIRGVVQNIHHHCSNTILSKNYQTLAGDPFIEEIICGLTFKVSPASFFQVNPPQAENLYKKVHEFCTLQGHETLLDAYCGVGTLSLILAPHVNKVIGIESVPEAIQDAEMNAQRNNIKNATFLCGTAEKVLPSISNIDIAILNPPRKGCDPRFLENLQSPRIVYVSCDPATLARDLALLHHRGYKVKQVQPFDMFPQTVHVESVAQLTR